MANGGRSESSSAGLDAMERQDIERDTAHLAGSKYLIVEKIRQVASVSFAVQIASTGLGLVSSVLLTHWLGPRNFGLYSYVLAVTGIAGVLGGLGFSTLLVRETAAWKATSNWGFVKGLLFQSSGLTFMASIAFGFAVWVVGLRLGHLNQIAGFRTDLFLAIVLMIFSVQLSIITSALQGLNKVVASLIPGSLGIPLFFLICISGLHWGKGVISVTNILSCQIGIALAVIAIQILQFFKSVPPQWFKCSSRIRFPDWLYKAFPFLINGMLTTINLRTDVFLL